MKTPATSEIPIITSTHEKDINVDGMQSNRENIKNNEQIKNNQNSQLALFREWIQRIYLDQAKIPELYLQCGGLQLSPSWTDISDITLRTLKKVLMKHYSCIQQAMEMIEEGFKNNQYSDINNPKKQHIIQTSIPKATKNADKSDNNQMNQMYYQCCIWMLYQHYCVISQCNKQACRLLEILYQKNELTNFFDLFKSKPTVSSINSYCNKLIEKSQKQSGDKFIYLDDEQNFEVNQSYLNNYTVKSLISLIIPSFYNHEEWLQKLLNFDINVEPTSRKQYDEIHEILSLLNYQQIKKQIKKISGVIHGIVYNTKLNLYDYSINLSQFQEALRLICNQFCALFRYKQQIKSSYNKQLEIMLQNKQIDEKLFNMIYEKQPKKKSKMKFIEDQDFFKASVELQQQIDKQFDGFEEAANVIGDDYEKYNGLEHQNHNQEQLDYLADGVSARITRQLRSTPKNDYRQNKRDQYKHNLDRNAMQRHLAESQARFRHNKISKGTQKFQFKSRINGMKSKDSESLIDEQLSKLTKKQRMHVKKSKADYLTPFAEGPETNTYQPPKNYCKKQWIIGEGEDIQQSIEQFAHTLQLHRKQSRKSQQLCLHLENLLESTCIDPEYATPILNQQSQFTKKYLNQPQNNKRSRGTREGTQSRNINLQCQEQLDILQKQPEAKPIRIRYFDQLDADLDVQNQELIDQLELDSQQVGLHQINLHEYLCLHKQAFKYGSDYGMYNDEGSDQSEQMKKKKKKKNKKKKNKNKLKSQQQISTVITPDSTIKEKIQQKQSNLQKTQNNNCSQQSGVKNGQTQQISQKAKQTIKLLSNFNFNKQARYSCFDVDEKLLKQWIKQSQDDKMHIDNESRSMTKSKERRRSRNRIK